MTRLTCVLFALAGWVGAAAEPLRTVREIRRLQPAEVAGNPEARVTGVVTYVAAWDGRSECAVQDATGGIYTYLKDAAKQGLRLGDVVEIQGKGTKGVWAPCLEVGRLAKLGRSDLPLPQPADYAELKSGLMDSQLVVAEGIVRDVQYDWTVSPPSTIVTLAMRGGRAEVFMALQREDGFRDLIDSKVLVTAVPFHYFNQRRQIFEFRLVASEAHQIEVIGASPSKPFDLETSRVSKLLQYRPDGYSDHRVRVGGVVTLHWPGQFLFLQDGEDGLLVKSRQEQVLKPGDRVDVAGFATMGDYAAFMEDAKFRVTESGRPPAAVKLPLEALITGDADARLVKASGIFESVSERDGRAVLTLRQGLLIVPGELPPGVKAPGILPGSLVELTGVCQVEPGPRRRYARLFTPESARLLLRSADDVRVLRAASWWTNQRLTLALAAAGAVLGVAIVWAWSLRTRNARLRSEIGARERAETEVKRREDEKKILAADLHDSLEQSLTGVALQLHAAAAGAANNPHLEIAGRLLKHSREEVHRAVSELRRPTAEPFDLAAAIREMARRMSAGSGVEFLLEVPETGPGLPGYVGHPLLHLAQEGVTNALKHAAAGTIRIRLERVEGGVCLEITDDGKGFDRAAHPGPREGHFGLQGMKERIARLEGTLDVDSAPAAGTRIRVTIPLNP